MNQSHFPAGSKKGGQFAPRPALPLKESCMKEMHAASLVEHPGHADQKVHGLRYAGKVHMAHKSISKQDLPVSDQPQVDKRFSGVLYHAMSKKAAGGIVTQGFRPKKIGTPAGMWTSNSPASDGPWEPWHKGGLIALKVKNAKFAHEDTANYVVDRERKRLENAADKVRASGDNSTDGLRKKAAVTKKILSLITDKQQHTKMAAKALKDHGYDGFIVDRTGAVVVTNPSMIQKSSVYLVSKRGKGSKVRHIGNTHWLAGDKT